ncbi:uncharacterized protein PV09_08337 [Verruconis gallopava]|uniref:Uncharacterized protein n=1 Tax=Verruconis gallopava TaxID=253628 RepID=A0A0D1YH63_9PEZI|nr:uncharacterized protein PV09_08337 [Verruconis gallopava]KIW00162.1 hypothetical protein PV09_08337 [Verruconis gallopava]
MGANEGPAMIDNSEIVRFKWKSASTLERSEGTKPVSSCTFARFAAPSTGARPVSCLRGGVNSAPERDWAKLDGREQHAVESTESIATTGVDWRQETAATARDIGLNSGPWTRMDAHKNDNQQSAFGGRGPMERLRVEPARGDGAANGLFSKRARVHGTAGSRIKSHVGKQLAPCKSHVWMGCVCWQSRSLLGPEAPRTMTIARTVATERGRTQMRGCESGRDAGGRTKQSRHSTRRTCNMCVLDRDKTRPFGHARTALTEATKLAAKTGHCGRWGWRGGRLRDSGTTAEQRASSGRPVVGRCCQSTANPPPPNLGLLVPGRYATTSTTANTSAVAGSTTVVSVRQSSTFFPFASFPLAPRVGLPRFLLPSTTTTASSRTPNRLPLLSPKRDGGSLPQRPCLQHPHTTQRSASGLPSHSRDLYASSAACRHAPPLFSEILKEGLFEPPLIALGPTRVPALTLDWSLVIDNRQSMMQESTAYHTMAVSNRASTRLSTYSLTPTLAPSIAPSHLSTTSETPSEKANPLAQDIRELHQGLARLDQPKLDQQRYAVSETKKDDMNKLALGAKLERALGRRMVSQDASFTKGLRDAGSSSPQKPRYVDVMEYTGRGEGSSKQIAV